MAAFEILVRSLRRVENELEAQLAGVKAAIASLADSRGRVGSGPTGGRSKGTGKAIASSAAPIKKRVTQMSAAGRAAISAAQKKRWAAVKAAKGGTKKPSAKRTK